MIHCGSVHQNARVIKIELLPGLDKDDGAAVEDDGLGALEARPRSRTSTGRESVLSHRSSSPSSDYESGTGSSMQGSVPVSRSGSFRGNIGDIGTGDDHGSASDDVFLLGKRHCGSSAQGMIPITTMRTFRRMSIKNSSHSDLPLTSLPRGSSTSENTEAIQDTKDEDEDEDNPSAEMSTGSRARVIFRFCHDVAFMREGTTVLFKHGRTKCVGKVLRML